LGEHYNIVLKFEFIVSSALKLLEEGLKLVRLHYHPRPTRFLYAEIKLCSGSADFLQNSFPLCTLCALKKAVRILMKQKKTNNKKS